MTSDRPPKRPDPLRPPLCLHFVTRIYRERAPMISLPFNLQDPRVRNICPSCLRAKAVEVPRRYADLTELGICSFCGAKELCRDVLVLRRYEEAGIDPDLIYIQRWPILRQSLVRDPLSIESVDAIIAGYLGYTREQAPR